MFSRRAIKPAEGGVVPPETDQIITVQTTSPDESFTFSLRIGATYDSWIDWGDGSPLSNITSPDDPDRAHVYSNPGIHTIRISGVFGGFSFNNSGDKDKLITIETWGDILYEDIREAFYGCSNLRKAGDKPIGVIDGDIASIPSAFRGTDSLEFIPDGLFDNFRSTTHDEMFNGGGLKAIPPGLFDIINSNASFRRAFIYCGLSSIPANLFDFVTVNRLNQFDQTFRSNPDLATVPSGLFDNCVNSVYYGRCFTGCGLTQQSVDNVLISIDTAGASGGTLGLDGGTNSPPGAAGLAAKASLESKGWTVNTN